MLVKELIELLLDRPQDHEIIFSVKCRGLDGQTYRINGESPVDVKTETFARGTEESRKACHIFIGKKLLHNILCHLDIIDIPHATNGLRGKSELASAQDNDKHHD